MSCLCQSPKQVTLHSVIIGSESGGCQENALGRLKILTLSKLSCHSVAESHHLYQVALFQGSRCVGGFMSATYLFVGEPWKHHVRGTSRPMLTAASVCRVE